MKILITGTAGFIGQRVAKLLQWQDHELVSLDSLNNYYDRDLKLSRLRDLGFPTEQLSYARVLEHKDHRFYQLQLEDFAALDKLFKREKIDTVLHLAAQAGVRYSVENPRAYLDSNMLGFFNILEACRLHNVRHLVFASSSSVYGMNHLIPYSEDHPTAHPLSIYAATKRAGECLAHSYANIFNLATTGVRFFTVYGEWGRPDMAPMIFANKIAKGEAISVYNYGKMARDYTYGGDIAEGLLRILPKIPQGITRSGTDELSPAVSTAPFRILNIGRGEPVNLLDFIKIMEEEMGGRPVEKILLPMQVGDVKNTAADISKLQALTGYTPRVSIREGIRLFVRWYKDYYAS